MGLRCLTVVLVILSAGCTATLDGQHSLVNTDAKVRKDERSVLLENPAQPTPLGLAVRMKNGTAPAQQDSTSSELEARDRLNVDSSPLNLE